MTTPSPTLKQKMAFRHIFSRQKRKGETEPVEEKGDGPPDQQKADKSTPESKELEFQLENTQKEFESDDSARATGGDLNCLPLEQWEEQTSADPIASLARTALYSPSSESVLLNREREIKDKHYFSISISKLNSPIANQGSTGRCWLVACTNILRYHIRKSKRLAYSRDNGFQLSLSYLSFYGKLEKT